MEGEESKAASLSICVVPPGEVTAPFWRPQTAAALSLACSKPGSCCPRFAPSGLLWGKKLVSAGDLELQLGHSALRCRQPQQQHLECLAFPHGTGHTAIAVKTLSLTRSN